ncbi:DUF1028 domain-containing protein [Saccharospirillum mangrovi]|uniref:DUF1028 domain-containing protein n=1 Tax=Saccharospirillum mangrovi TaxID=2161747 RepID=UPI000D3D76E5|nr:DUF1028 domain-containing protein [Saccharospirillum mangrovi]
MTYSIVARDPNTGALGVATATGSVAVGGFVPHVRYPVGAIATQGAFTNWLYGDRGLALLANDQTAEQVRDRLIADDEGQAQRQLLICDAQGRTAAHTGTANLGEKKHHCTDNLALAGNILASEQVIDAMLDAYLSHADWPLHERLISALAAGEAEGGDQRGTHSATVRVHSPDKPPIDLRVDWADAGCIDQLKALLNKTRAHAFQAFLDGVPTHAHPAKTGHVSDEEVR